MIEKMKKFTFLVTNSEYEGFISQVRELGVVHIQQLQEGATGEKLQGAISLQRRFQDAITFLEKKSAEYAKEASSSVSLEKLTPQTLLEKVESMQKEELQLCHKLDDALSAIKQFEPWGEFDQKALNDTLESTGLSVYFWRTSSKLLQKSWIDDYNAISVAEHEKRNYFVTFSPNIPDIQAEQILLPEGTLSEWKAKEDEIRKELHALAQSYVAIHEEQLHILLEGLVSSKNDVALEKVHLSDTPLAEGSVRMLVGWVKAISTEALQQYLEEQHIYYEVSDPRYEDEVPISLVNNGFSRLFEPILNMYSLPNYSDIDPTAYFAPFFMLFFGLCMGDSGYGLLILALGLYLAFFGSKDMRPYGRLACCLGGMTVLCGFATATFFGINLTEQDWAWVQPFKPYFLTDNGVGEIFGYTPMMVLSVIIGLIQVLLGMLLKGIKLARNYGLGYGIASFSWFIALLAAIVLYGIPACGWTLTFVAQIALYVIIGIASLGIFLYNNPSAYKNPLLGPLVNIGGGVWATYGMSTGLLGDLLSYIRLFALGLTGGVLGGVFNSLAYTISSGIANPALQFVVMAIILLAGHGITFALSTISAFVHPMRLTFVEFFKNSDFAGGGKAYSPFREEK